MKLPNMALVFAIIIIPISLVFSTYVGYQVSTISTQSTYDTRIVTATRDAIEALELNTFGDATKDLPSSTRRNVQASINTFANSFASNFNISGYDNSDVLIYVPALLFTMYDGYYIYAPTTENQAGEDGNTYNKHVLKPYIYYSARYKKDTGMSDEGYDVVINYSLDNYITITGTVGGKYVAKSGYLIDIDTEDIIEFGTEPVESKYSKEDDGKPTVRSKVVKYDGVDLQSEALYETLSFYEEDFNMDGYINAADFAINQNAVKSIILPDETTDDGVSSQEPNKITLRCQYCYKNNEKYYYCADGGVVEGDLGGTLDYTRKWYKYDNTGHVTMVNDKTLDLDPDNIDDYSAQNYYQDAYDFSQWVKDTFGENGIKANTMLKPDGTPVKSLTDPSDSYYIFNDDDDTTTNVLNAVGDVESQFNQHKLSVMQNSITYNLNVAISNYAKASGIYDFAMPAISENEWNKILTNISMVSFVQGMPIGFKTYNNYAIVTSTNNQMYVSEDSIYYVENKESETTEDKHHAVNCTEIEAAAETVTGYPSTEFDMYTVNYLTEGFIKDNSSSSGIEYWPEKDHYLSFFRHQSLDCYDCIVNKNNVDSSKNMTAQMKKARILAIGRIKYNQYKATQYINDQVLK